MYVLMISELCWGILFYPHTNYVVCTLCLPLMSGLLGSPSPYCDESLAGYKHSNHLTSKTISTNLVLRPSYCPVLAAYRGGRLGTVYHMSNVNVYLGEVDREGVGWRGDQHHFIWGYATRRMCTTCQCLSLPTCLP